MSDPAENTGRLTRRSVLAGAIFTANAIAAAPAAAMSSSRKKRSPKMDLDRFIDDCVTAGREQDAQSAVREVLARAVGDSPGVRAALGEPARAGITVLHRSPALTIFNAAWTPQMNLMPHNHLMWALIGIYTGREDNIFWRQSDGAIRAFGADALFEGDVATLPPDVIHSVTNPLLRFTGGIHIYGGDFFAQPRTQWDPETLAAEPSDGDKIRHMFERENERLGLD
jgi:predicted metal-dependent enzyme (double-stranded beta helix superfamily)